jgi:DNA-binding GntR family transcriptional regulator
MTRDATISRSVLSDQVKDRLLQAILDGRYPPGARIVETRVARELGTSQAPVREALRDLEALGVVETAAFRGARVRRPSAAELLEAFVIRAELESLAARLAIPRMTDDDIGELDGYIREMQDAADTGDVHAEATADAAFHGRIVELAGNATLQRVWRTLEPFSRTYITIVAPGADRRRIAEEHVPVLDALRRRDPELAVEILHQHFTNAATMLGSLWAELPPAGAPESALDAARPPLRAASPDEREMATSLVERPA